MLVTWSVDNRPKATRAKHPKLKTGCVTCKARHVRCDERKPNCQNCENVGKTCGGYQSRPRRSRQELATIAPNYGTAIPNGQTIPGRPSQTLFESQHEFLCFNFFVDVTSKQLCGYFDSKFWGHFLLQLCESHKSVLALVVAIGFVDMKTVPTSETGYIDTLRRPSDSKKLLTLSENKYALHQYGIAIRELRQSVLDGSANIRTCLTCCLLFITVDTFLADTRSVLGHLHSGMKMVAGRTQTSPPASTMSEQEFEEEIVESFKRLDLVGTTTMDRRFYDPTLYLPLYITVPDVFANLQEARKSLTDITRRLIRFKALMFTRTTAGPTTLTSAALTSLPPPSESQKPFLQHQTEILGDLDRWYHAFHRLLRETDGSKESDFAAKTLEIQHLSAHVSTVSAAHGPELREGIDPMDHIFAKINSLARSLLTPTFKKQFKKDYLTVGIHLVVPLYHSALKCSSRQIRRETIDILEESGWLEGFYCGKLVAEILKWVTSIEEKDGGGRLTQLQAVFDDDTDRVLLKAEKNGQIFEGEVVNAQLYIKICYFAC